MIERGDDVCRGLAKVIEYIPERLVRRGTAAVPVVDTKFHVSHDGMKKMKEQAARSERRWALGDISEGEEWFAVTFADQPVQDVGQDRLEHLLEAGDAAWIEAYERMTLGEGHLWHRHAAAEVAFILGQSALSASNNVSTLDIGCGDGRHVRELHKAGFDSYGIDIAPRLIAAARDASPTISPSQFEISDGRSHSDDGIRQHGLVTLLYDVIGSSADRADDVRLLENARRALLPEGILALSVMNRVWVDSELADNHVAHNQADLVSKLESLQPSNAMEQSGSVFDPACIIQYAGLYYRKEQFVTEGNELPAEMIVRDRRFSESEIVALVTGAGFEPFLVRPVQAGHWERQPPLDPTDQRAKEWLVLARLTLSDVSR